MPVAGELRLQTADYGQVLLQQVRKCSTGWILWVWKPRERHELFEPRGQRVVRQCDPGPCKNG